MALKLMYITNNPEVARIAENVGIDRIFVDMEYIGKSLRQEGMDTVQSHHTVEDVKNIRTAVNKAQVMVRVNPIHEATADYGSSKEEIDAVIKAGADIIMLPYFKSVEEVKTFLELVDGRAKTLPLLETPEAVAVLPEILRLPGLEEIFIGLNDLSLGYGMKFMFQLLADGTVDRLTLECREAGIPFGFGGIASLGKGLLPAEYIVREHYRLGSTCVILSRSFCNANTLTDLKELQAVFASGVEAIRTLEAECEAHASFFSENRKTLQEKVNLIVEGLES